MDNELIIDQRYWLDNMRDISGVVRSIEDLGNGKTKVSFGNIEGNYIYILDENEELYFIITESEILQRC